MNYLPLRLTPLLLMLASGPVAGQEPAAAEPVAAEEPAILGLCTVAQLQESTHGEWLNSGFDDYQPDAKMLEALRGLDVEDLHVSVFFGTWCGDSRREVPRVLKVLDAMGFPESNQKLIALDRSEPLYKRSPSGEEEGFEIYRVPTVVVSRAGKEVSRIVEFPMLSLERDLLSILQGNEYRPAYPSYPQVRSWLEHGLLADPNISADGLGLQIASLVSSESELAAAAHVLSSRGDVLEAAKLQEVNCSLHWASSSCHTRLARIQIKAGDLQEARKSVVRALKRNDDREAIDLLVELLDQTATP